jgi:hypothetical protein
LNASSSFFQDVPDLPDSVGGIEQVIFQLCESGAQYGVEGRVLTLSADPTPPVVQLGLRLR